MTTRDVIDAGGHTDWLATASRTAHVAVGISNLASGVFVEANDAFCRQFHRTRDQILGRTAVELDLWPDARQQQRLLDIVHRDGGVNGFELRYRNSLGETGDLEISARVVQQGGEALLIGFLTDVTDRREFVEGLRSAQDRLSIVLRSSNILVFRQDKDLRYSWVANPALGATEGELIGRSDEDIMGADAAAPLVAIKRRVLNSGCPERRDVWVANNGQLGCFDLVVEPERDAAGRVVGILCAAQDITQRMMAHRESVSAQVKAIQGLTALLGRESLTLRQTERVKRIGEEVGRLVRTENAIPALRRLRQRHAGTLVLVAEENPVVAEGLCAMLELAGLQVAPARTGVEAFSFAIQLKPALLLLDMEFPQRGGVAAARAVRATATRPMPILAMLSDRPLEGVDQALDADLDDVMVKPVVADTLYEKVLAWLEV